MPWRLVGSVAVDRRSGPVLVGPVVAPETGGLLLKVASPTAVPFHLGCGHLAYVSSYGRELGWLKVCPDDVATVHHLGPGLRVRDRRGLLVFDPRTWGRRWLLAGFRLSLLVLADLPDPTLADSIPAEGVTDGSGSDLFLTRAGSSGRLTFLR